MKKKINDLTLREVRKICDVNICNEDCPFRARQLKSSTWYCIIEHFCYLRNKKIFETIIEVEDED